MNFAIIVLFLAFIQGVCEFLPISSSGHLLVLGKYFLPDGTVSDESQQIALSVLLHAGTFLSILVVYRRVVIDMFLRDRRLLAMVIVATIPTGLIGLGIKKCAATLETSLPITAAGFLVTAALLFCVIALSQQRAQHLPDEKPTEQSNHFLQSLQTSRFSQNISFYDAFFIGLIQGIAVLPGFSRSGLTLAAGIARRLSQAEAAAFSFLIALPALAGAILVELIHPILTADASVSTFFVQHAPLLTAAFVISFVVGIAALKLLLHWLQQGKLHYWGYWLIAMAILTLLAILH